MQAGLVLNLKGFFCLSLLNGGAIGVDNHAQRSGCAFRSYFLVHPHSLLASFISEAVTTAALYPHLPVRPARPLLFFQRILGFYPVYMSNPVVGESPWSPSPHNREPTSLVEGPCYPLSFPATPTMAPPRSWQGTSGCYKSQSQWQWKLKSNCPQFLSL